MWNISLLREDRSEPLATASSEEEAIHSVLNEARKNTPSQILRIALNGDTRLIAKFDKATDIVTEAERLGIHP